MEVNKNCVFCGVKFVAKKTTTKCCSDNCAKRLYKQVKRDEKIRLSSDLPLLQVETFDIVEIQKKEYLSVKETMALLGISRTSIYRMIEDGRLRKIEGFKAVRIRRSDFDRLFDKKIEKTDFIQYKLPYLSNDNYYTINEVLKKFNISSGSFYNLCKKHQIPKIPNGKSVFVPKDLVNKIFNYE